MARLAGWRPRRIALLALAQRRMVLEGTTAAVPAVRLVVLLRHGGNQRRRSPVVESWSAGRVRSRRSRRRIPDVGVALPSEQLLAHPLALLFQIADFAFEMFQINNLEIICNQRKSERIHFKSIKFIFYGLLALDWMREMRKPDSRW